MYERPNVTVVITTIIAILIVVWAAWFVFGSNAPATGQSYYLEHGDFSVYFPEQPTYSLTSQELTKGNNVSDNNYSWSPVTGNPNGLIEATYISSPFADSNLTPEENLKKEAEYTGNTGGSELISSNPTTFHGFPAIDYVLSNQLDKSQPALHIVGRDILKGNDLYMLEYGYYSNQEDNQLEKTFLDSLTFGKARNSIDVAETKSIYTITTINVHSCPSLDCKVINRFLPNSDLTSSISSFNPKTSDISQLPEWVTLNYTNLEGVATTGYVNRSVLSDHQTLQSQVAQSDSSPTNTSAPVGTLCNGTSYSACPVGQDFVCPASGGKAYCQTAQQTQNSTALSDNTLSSVIAEWHPFIAYILCNFHYADGTSYSIQGSGTVSKTSDNIFILTNKHVVTDVNGYGADICKAAFPLDTNKVPLSWSATDYKILPTLDVASLPISNPTSYITNLANSKTNRCAVQPPIGEEIAILGYPTNGSKTDITATEGIISGYDGDYYITSAKVDHGNSGGAAIDIKNDCYLGIPTYYIGDVESLARILKWQAWSSN
jgi:S1-C subfamily serine protease